MEHGVSHIDIKNDVTVLHCICEWKSKEHKSEIDAQNEYQKHVEKEKRWRESQQD